MQNPPIQNQLTRSRRKPVKLNTSRPCGSTPRSQTSSHEKKSGRLSADRPDIEEKRIEFIWVETMHRIMGPLAKMARRFYADLWKDCMEVEDLDDVTRVSRSLRIVDGNLRYAAKFATDGPGSTWEERVVQIYRAAECAHWSARGVTAVHHPKVWNAAFSILDEAIRLGKHKVIERAIAIRRLEAAKQRIADADRAARSHHARSGTGTL
jgi:hypothetical protein